MFPFKRTRLEMSQIRWVMLGIWTSAIFLSGLPLIYRDYFKNFYGRTGVCLALCITTDKNEGWKYSAFIFVFLNFLSFSIIAIGYVWMYGVAKTTRLAVCRNVESKKVEQVMARRMILIVATDAACWVPIIFLGILSLNGVAVPSQVFAWVAVFVLPLNAAVNPVFYTISTTTFLNPAKQNFKRFNRSLKLPSSSASYGKSSGVKFKNSKPFHSQLHYWSPSFHETRENNGELIKLNKMDSCNSRLRRRSVLITKNVSTRIKSKERTTRSSTVFVESRLETSDADKIETEHNPKLGSLTPENCRYSSFKTESRLYNSDSDEEFEKQMKCRKSSRSNDNNFKNAREDSRRAAVERLSYGGKSKKLNKELYD